MNTLCCRSTLLQSAAHSTRRIMNCQRLISNFNFVGKTRGFNSYKNLVPTTTIVKYDVDLIRNIRSLSTYSDKHYYKANEEEDLDQLENLYMNRVTLIGDLCYNPSPLSSNGQVIGYKFTVLTKSKGYSFAADTYFVKYMRHQVVCWKKNYLPIIENNLTVNSRVLIEGYLQVYTPNKPLLENNEKKVDIVATKLEVLPSRNHPVDEQQSDSQLSVWD